MNETRLTLFIPDAWPVLGPCLARAWHHFERRERTYHVSFTVPADALQRRQIDVPYGQMDTRLVGPDEQIVPN